MASELPFNLLQSLPPGICGRLIFPFLDGKALSTLFLAVQASQQRKKNTSSDDPDETDVTKSIVHYGNGRLEVVCQAVQKQLVDIDDQTNNQERGSVGRQIRPFLAMALHCLRQFLVHPQQQQQEQHVQSKQVSDLMIACDAFCFAYHTLGQSYHAEVVPRSISHRALQAAPPVMEWPIWCGMIQLPLWIPCVSFHGVQRIVLEANVVLMSPTFDEKHYLAWDALAASDDDSDDDNSSNNKSTVELVAEAYNFIPTPPMGRLVGVQSKDRQVLQQMAERLSEQNTVAILASSQADGRRQQQLRDEGGGHRRRLLQTVRIISRRQGRERITRSRMQRMPFAFYVQQEQSTLPLVDDVINDDDNNNDLLCCWEYVDLFQDAILTAATDCAPYWKKLIQARQRYLSRQSEDEAS